MFNRNKYKKPEKKEKPAKRRPDELAKMCLVKDVASGKPMNYDEANKVLFVDPKGGYRLFPSKSRAHSAKHHTIAKDEAAGVFGTTENYEVIEA